MIEVTTSLHLLATHFLAKLQNDGKKMVGKKMRRKQNEKRQMIS